MIQNEKDNCVDSIIRVLEGTAAWRKIVAFRHPEDTRNQRAIERLSQLAKDAANLSDEQWSLLEPAYSSAKWRDALSLVARQVGFHHRAASLDTFVMVLANQLSISVAA